MTSPHPETSGSRATTELRAELDNNVLQNAHMTSVGIRELRQRASELLRLVEAGETIEVTDRGRPVAVLAPLPDRGALDRLRAAGDVTDASEVLDDLPEPLRARRGQPSPSTVLAQLRRDER
jgi:prevent-host-death family protein